MCADSEIRMAWHGTPHTNACTRVQAANKLKQLEEQVNAHKNKIKQLSGAISNIGKKVTSMTSAFGVPLPHRVRSGR